MATSDGGQPPPSASRPSDADDDVVITTVVSADDPRPPADDPFADGVGERPAAGFADDEQIEWGPPSVPQASKPEPPPPPSPPLAPPPPPPPPATDTAEAADAPAPEPDPDPDRSASIGARLAALEGLPATVEAMGRAVRHELKRCADVLFGHDRALGAIASRLDALESRAPESEPAVERAQLNEENVALVLDGFARLEQRVNAAEARVEPLEPLPTLVQALRRAVRASDELIAGEGMAREQALEALAGRLATEAEARDDGIRRLVAQDLDRVSGVSTAQAKGLADLAERLAAAESGLSSLSTVPEDVAALSRVLRRELEAVVSDNQARDQMLRRALQNEIDQLQATSEAREALARELATRLEALEGRSSDAGGRLETLETRAATLDRLDGDVASIKETVEQLRAGGQAADQLAGELTRRLSAVDGRLARLDPLPGEVQSLRTALLQEAERTVASLRAVDERLAQLAWIPGEFQEARKRIMALTTGLQSGQDKVRQLEGAVASTSERLDALRARLSTAAPPATPG